MSKNKKSKFKLYYSMGEVCEMFDLPASTIRFWEKNFSQIRPKKNAKGNRMFTPEDIKTLKIIYHLVREKGMTLSGADNYLNDKNVAARSEMEVVELLQSVRAKLLTIKEEINSYEKQQVGEIIIGQGVENEYTQEEILQATELIQRHGAEELIKELSVREQAEVEDGEKPAFIELTLF